MHVKLRLKCTHFRVCVFRSHCRSRLLMFCSIEIVAEASVFLYNLYTFKLLLLLLTFFFYIFIPPFLFLAGIVPEREAGPMDRFA